MLIMIFNMWWQWDGATSSNDGGDCLAIGCSDNSVNIWDMLRCSLLSRVRCSGWFVNYHLFSFILFIF